MYNSVFFCSCRDGSRTDDNTYMPFFFFISCIVAVAAGGGHVCYVGTGWNCVTVLVGCQRSLSMNVSVVVGGSVLLLQRNTPSWNSFV